MDIFMRNIDYFASQHDVVRALAVELHRPEYSTGMPMNFHVRLFKAKRGSGPGRTHSGCGTLTVPYAATGEQFLREFGDDVMYNRRFLIVKSKKIAFKRSTQGGGSADDILISIRNTPYLDPQVVEERERVSKMLRNETVSISRIQFGWDCRDQIYSVEWDYPCVTATKVSFNNLTRQLSVNISSSTDSDSDSTRTHLNDLLVSTLFGDSTSSSLLHIIINYSQIDYVATNIYSETEPVILLALLTPPSFEKSLPETPLSAILRQPPNQRFPALPLQDSNGRPHEEVAPYTSLSLRLVCQSPDALQRFKRSAEVAGLNMPIDNYYYPIEHRDLFASSTLKTFFDWLPALDFITATQVEALVRNHSVDPKEIFELRPEIERLMRDARKMGTRGTDYVSMVLQMFGAKCQQLYWYPGDNPNHWSLKSCLRDCRREHDKVTTPLTLARQDDDSLFFCLHVQVTPTGRFIEGPTPERSNRVIRSYAPYNRGNFIRVSFLDEGRLKLQFNREINGPDFVRTRVGPILSKGLKVGGRRFEFLAYSQSALKEHAVWFMTPFVEGGQRVDVQSIIESLGSFSNLSFDRRLIYCPARYAARISQGFTTTDPTYTEVENIEQIDDIISIDSQANKWNHTDGVGTMSPAFAKRIHADQQAGKRGRRIPLNWFPPALQIRFEGSKGVLSVDYRLAGMTICLRPSMIKFTGAPSKTIEIAKVFDKPGVLFLNRPLIMLYEGLGVPYETFKYYQDLAVQDAHDSMESFELASHFFQVHGLGSSFRLPSVMGNLVKVGISMARMNDPFLDKVCEYATNHVLRLLKHRARIPIPGAYNLVGIADIHHELDEREVFIYIRPVDGSPAKYLSGPCLVSRSPTIHPGDVQIVHAIGAPRPGSCFEKEPLANTLVFSTRGQRSMPSCLGGGDLDGDEYNVVPLDDLPMFWVDHNKIQVPSMYPPAPRKELDRPCNHDDIAEFVMEYITSDVLGYISINWRILADQSPAGIFHPDCIKLADLHSLAVDYPKSGNPVPISTIPRRDTQLLPDWYAPETMKELDTTKYYPSQKAIGKLFRDIDLPASTRNAENMGRRQWRRFAKESEDVEDDDVDELVSFMETSSLDTDSDEIYQVIEAHVSEYLDLDDAFGQDNTFDIHGMFISYRSELQTICSMHTLSRSLFSMLTEEEAVVGTIVANTTQVAKRLDHMAKLREQTDILVRGVRDSLAGDEECTLEESLARAFFAFRLAVAYSKRKKPVFGAKSFWWVTLGAVFEAVKNLEEEEMQRKRKELSLRVKGNGQL